MSDEMYRQRIESLEEHTDKLVERNDQLRKELEWVGDLNRALVDGHEKAVREVVRICYALGDGEDCPKNADDAVDWVVALKAQVAELQANNAALTAQVSQWLGDDDNAEDWHGRTGHDVM